MTAGGITTGTLERTTFPNGLTVLSEHMPGVRSVAFGAWVRSASLHERPEVMGVSHLLEHMVFKGTATRSAKERNSLVERGRFRNQRMVVKDGDRGVLGETTRRHRVCSGCVESEYRRRPSGT